MRNNIARENITTCTVLLLGTVIRLIFAPFSSGSDIPQFLGFANTLEKHGFCFYMYATGDYWTEEKWPYPWTYVYFPLWGIILYVLKIAANGYVKSYFEGSMHIVKVSMEWILAVKAVLILCDIAIALLIFAITRRARYVAVYYLNPVTIYNSSIYGMFDNVALLFLILSIYLYLKGRTYPALALAGLSLTTKHSIILASAPLFLRIYFSLGKKNFKQLIRFFSTILVSVFGLLLPFIMLCPPSLHSLIKCLTMPAGIYYTEPICYSFNGLSSLLTYVNKEYGYETLYLIKAIFLVFAASALIMLCVTVYVTKKGFKEITILTFISYLVFAALYWRVNYQYFVPVIGLGSLALSKVKHSISRMLILSTIIYPSIWFFMFPVTFWFHYHVLYPNKHLIGLLNMVSLNIYCSSIIYVMYSLGLTTLYVITLLYLGLRVIREVKGNPAF